MLNRIVLNNFRNYQNLVLDIGEKNNVLIGDNGQGKTNFLEAIYFTSMLRSFKTSRINEIKNLDSKDFFIGLLYNNKVDKREKLTIKYSNGKKKLSINDQVIRKSSLFINRFKTVVFAPTDINIVVNNAAYRRRFIDIIIITLEEQAVGVMYEYNTALKQRNALLRRGKCDYELLGVFDEIIARNGAKIANWRKIYLEKLFLEVADMVATSSSLGQDNLFNYHYSSNDNYLCEKDFLALLSQNHERDIQRKISSTGIHLDDIDFFLNEKILRKYGSNGQCRMLSLILKMAQLKLLSKFKKDDSEIIVLVDDVTGDLDERFKEQFFEIIKVANQMFFTFTDEYKTNFIGECCKYRIKNNEIVTC
ncbi:DNA replication and repair protein RecF [Lentisphaerota bacterium WC36G]|nr:DNA replication and repair protein RecF [Lentisphaerae bacterium WC36]